MKALPGIGFLLVFTCLGLPNLTKCQTRVSAVDCQTTGTECNSIDNADCDTQKCKCNAGYKEDTNDGSTCVKARVSAVVCKAAGTECDGIDHADCDSQKCKCSTGYIEDTNDGTTCVNTRVSLITCTKGSECDNIDHSTCDTPTHKCKCDAGYVENTPGGDSCVQGSQQTKPQVSTVVCSTTGTECSAIPFAVCDKPTNLKCKCKDGYKEDSNGGSTCIKVLNTVTCSANGKECDKPDHAECDDKGKCTCAAGFTMNVDVCIAKNSGTTLTMKLGIFVLPVLVAIHAVFKW